MVDIAQTPVYALAVPVATNFQWSASNTTAVPAASTALASPAPNATVAVTAGSGVTALTALVQGSNDNAAWTTLATVVHTAPNTAQVVLAIPYLYVRVNVTAISGGSASATLTFGGAPLTAGAGQVMVNPQLTGVPIPGPFTAHQWGVPLVLPSSGSIGNNGALTGIAALPAILASCWMYFPANAISAGSSAGIYYVQMSSTTAGTIYNNTLTSGAPTIPTSPTPFVTTGPGAYTQTTSAVTLATLPILGGSMGANGAMRFEGTMLRPNNASVIGGNVKLGGTQIATLNSSTQQWMDLRRVLQNQGDQAKQIAFATATSSVTDIGSFNNAPSFLTINTAIKQDFTLEAFLATAATDYIIWSKLIVEILPAA